jgi:hypothetical protein
LERDLSEEAGGGLGGVARGDVAACRPGLYALQRGQDGRVLYLPVGELRDGVYTGNPVTPPRLAASKLDDLLLGWEGRMRHIVAEMTSN